MQPSRFECVLVVFSRVDERHTEYYLCVCIPESGRKPHSNTEIDNIKENRGGCPFLPTETRTREKKLLVRCCSTRAQTRPLQIYSPLSLSLSYHEEILEESHEAAPPCFFREVRVGGKLQQLHATDQESKKHARRGQGVKSGGPPVGSWLNVEVVQAAGGAQVRTFS